MAHDAKTYAECGTAIRKIFDSGEDFDITDHIPSIRAAKMDLFSIIHELTVPRRSRTTSQLAERVSRALKDLNPTVEYYTFEKVVLDLADVLVTLSKLEGGLKSTQESKVVEAKLFCEHMKHEMSEPE